MTSKKGKEPVIEEGEGWDSDWTSSDSKDRDYVVRLEEECYESDTSLEVEQIQGEIVDYYVCSDDEDDKLLTPMRRCMMDRCENLILMEKSALGNGTCS